MVLGEAVGLGDAFFFPLLLAEGDGVLLGDAEASGEALGVGVSVGVGVGEEVLFFFGDVEGEGVGDGLFFEEADGFFFSGGGVGSKRRLIFVPRSCAGVEGSEAATSATAQKTTMGNPILNGPIPAGPPCSSESPRPNFPAGSSR